MSKVKKGKDTDSIITIRSLCNVCKEVDTFQFSAKDLLPHIGGLYQVSTIHHCKDDKDMIMNIILDRNHAVRQSTVSPFIAEIEESRWSPDRVKDIKILAKDFKDSDKVINAILSSKLVVVAGNKPVEVKRIVEILELFSPRKYPLSEYWSEKVIKNKKIIGTNTKLANSYKDAIIVDIIEKRIIGGKSSLYCEVLIENLMNIDPKGMAYAAKLKIDMLVEYAKMLIELSKRKEIGSKALDLVKMDVSEDALVLIQDIVEGFDPTALEIIKENWL